MRSFYLLSAAQILLWSIPSVLAQGNTTCSDSALDWYTVFVGETPCRTYERLRQVCNSQYRVGSQNPNTPPDFCEDQVADCCCNSVAFSLSMLCLTCQQGTRTAVNGFDAGVNAYQQYLTGSRTRFCSPNTNQTLPAAIQRAVCNNNIKISNTLYGIFWGDGQWF
ncbi:hypothetical protein HGRIS_008437 [Hohenbuehelia grisea]|uniref:Uncharacterized protein n=1 Tax=Hohenbuehelia grisea TaxID=104357 RepID=A0ABR3J8E6_9AGAR